MDFSQISVLFVVASVFAIVARLLKQPVMVGYLFAGIVLSAVGYVKDVHVLESFSQIGVAMLLFLLGLEVKLSEFSAIGKHALYVSIGQIFFTTLIGILFCFVLGFSLVTSVFIAFALTFSSTIVLVKLLSEKKDLFSLYGRMAIGIMLVQDFVAIAALIFLTTQASGGSTAQYFLLPVKVVLLLFIVVFLSKRILPALFEKIAQNSQELLFISSVAWALGFSAFVAYPMGLSVEIGGYLAGIALSNLPENMQITSKARSIKDFFLTIFFLNLGLVFALDLEILRYIFVPAIILSTFILLGSPLIVMILMGLLGYKKRTSFLTGISIAQISEFSLILIALAANMGKIDTSVVALVVLIGIITMTASTYAIIHSEKLYKLLSKHLGVFEKKIPKEKALLKKSELKNHIILVGCHRTGTTLANFFRKKELDFVVVDFDPKVYSRLSSNGIEVILGDVLDPEILEAAGIESANMIISTISNYEDDIYILEYVKSIKKQPLTIFTSTQRYEALSLYQRGANFVLMPEMLAGEYIKNILRTSKFDKNSLEKAGKNYFERFTIASGRRPR